MDKGAHMTRQLFIAVLLALGIEVAAIGYGTVAAGDQDQVTCRQDHGVVRSHECVRDGRILFGVPL
jgi:hypothetical protein